MTLPGITIGVVVGGPDLDADLVSSELGLAGDCSWRSPRGGDAEWGIRRTSQSTLLDAVGPVLDVIERVQGRWESMLAQRSQWKAALVCTVDMRESGREARDCPDLELTLGELERINHLGMEVVLQFR